MKLNHLLSKHLAEGRCPNGKQHFWLPTGMIEAKLGDNVAISFYCRHCDKQEWTFLTYREYDIHKGLIHNAIKTNESTLVDSTRRR